MVEPVSICALRDVAEPNFPADPESEVAPRAVAPIDDVDQCLEAVADLALDIGYFSDLVVAERRLAMIRDWIQREMARYEAL